MAISGVQHKLRRGTNTQLGSFTGAEGEPTFDTTWTRLVMHDGATAGGFPHSLASVQTSTGSANVLATTAVFNVFSTAGAVTITLPLAVNYPPGQRLVIADGAGIANTFNITIQTSSNDLIYTSIGGTTNQSLINIAGAHNELMSNSSAHWILSSTT